MILLQKHVSVILIVCRKTWEPVEVEERSLGHYMMALQIIENIYYCLNQLYKIISIKPALSSHSHSGIMQCSHGDFFSGS